MKKSIRNRVIVTILVAAVTLPVFILAFYKPSRVLIPQINGLSCAEQICVDDTRKLNQAQALARAATDEVERQLGALSHKPTVVFCSSQACFESFGFKRATAKFVGTIAIVIGPRGWKDYYLRHELIHQWQADRLGLRAMRNMPEWLREGMAYELSDDPRENLAEPFQSYRARFQRWYESVDKRRLVEAMNQHT